MPAAKSAPSVPFTRTPVRNDPLQRPCTPPGSPGCGIAGFRSSPETTSMRSLNASSGFRIGVISKSVPSVAGVHSRIACPLGT